MQCYSELVPPTAVSHAVALPFLHAKANNLIVAKTSLLQVFEFRSVSTEVRSNGADISDEQQDIADDTVELELHRMEDTTKFSLICEYPLSGTVIDLKRVKIQNSKSGGEALLIALKDAKLSLVEWDPESYGLSTTSVHYYEGEGSPLCPWNPDLSICQNFLTVDPSSRCAALKFGQRQLAILPFRQASDDFAEDYDPDFDDPMDKKLDEAKRNGDGREANETPYKSSFVLSLTALDSTLTHPVHLAFLHGFRDPTFGILHSSKSASNSLLYERRDILNYTVFNLDIDQRASTSILSVTGLPNDLHQVIALPQPVGGALLMGDNELVHIDQDGKVNALAINEYAKVVSKFAMADGSSLGLRLEHCIVQQLGDQGDMLLVLGSGDLAIVSFEIEGRSVSGISVHKVSSEQGGTILPNGASCTSTLSRSRLFLGSLDSDALILGWSSAQTKPQLTRTKSRTDTLDEDEDMELDDLDLEDEDDIYGADEDAKEQRRSSSQSAVKPADYIFRIHDALPNFAPVGPMTLGAPTPRSATSASVSRPVSALELVYPCGRTSAGGLAVLHREIDPVVLSIPDLSNAKSVFGIRPMSDLTADAEYHEYVVAVQTSDSGEDRSILYKTTADGLEICTKDDFDPEAGATLEMGTLLGGKRIVQVLGEKVNVYDENFGLEQIIAASDETTGVELEVVAASFCDPYVALVRNDSSITVYDASSGELEELERAEGILTTRWLSACLYRPSGADQPLLFGLTAEGALRIFDLPDLNKAVFAAEGLTFLPKILSSEFVPRRWTGKETLTELLVADVGGQMNKSTYLIVRTKLDDLVMYEPFKYPYTAQPSAFTANLRWRKISQPRLAKYSEELELEKESYGRASMLRRLDNVGGYSTVFQAGTSPSFILKEAATLPRVVPLRCKAVKSLSRFHTATSDRGFIYITNTGTMRIAQLPPLAQYGATSWVARKVPLQQEVTAASYYAPKGLYCLSTVEKVLFKLPEDDYHHEWAKEDTSFLPTIDQSVLKLYHPRDWTLIDTYGLDPAEVILCQKIITLEVSEHTRARKPMLCVGTAIIHGEDLATKGHIYIFEINNVVPEPDRPETGSKFKLIVREDVRGAVTAITEIGDEGFLFHAMGQKCMIRGLKEDNTLLPVAFLDVQTQVTVAKGLGSTNMWLVGDAIKGLWFGGYTQDPYRISLFSKTKQRIEVVDAEFLPYEKHLYIIVADSEENLQVFEYDPEHPSSLAGQRLIPKAAFHLGHFPVSLTLLPSVSQGISQNPDSTDETPPPPSILILTQFGSIALLTPIDEQSYRRTTALHTYLTNQLDHAAGLNPRGYRAVEGSMRGVVDGDLLKRWGELPRGRWLEGIGKGGGDEWVIRGDLEKMAGGGLTYL